MSLFTHSVAAAVQRAAGGQAVLLALLLEETGHDGLLETTEARAELETLPVACLRLRRGAQDYQHFTSAWATAKVNTVMLVGAGGAVLDVIDTLSDAAIVARCKAALQKQAVNAMMAAMGQQAAAGAPAPAAASSSSSSPAPVSLVKELASASEFPTLIAAAPRAVVDYYADWCGPCKHIAPTFAALAAAHAPAITFIKVNADRFKPLVQAQGVTAYPTFHFYMKGKMVREVRGGRPEALEEAVRAFAAPEQAPVTIDWGDDGEKVAGDAGGDASAAAGEEGSTPVETARGDPRPAAAAAAPPTTAAKPAAKAVTAADLAGERRVNDAAAREAVLRKIEAAKARGNAAAAAEKGGGGDEDGPAPTTTTTAATPDTKTPAATGGDAREAARAPAAAKPQGPPVCRLSIRLLNGDNVRRTFDPEQTLNDVRESLAHDEPGKYVFVTAYPRRRYACTEEAATLADCGLVPSGTLTLQAVGGVPSGRSAATATSNSSSSSSSQGWGAYFASWILGSPASAEPAAPAAQPPPPATSSRHDRAQQRKAPDDADKGRYNGNGTAFEYGE